MIFSFQDPRLDHKCNIPKCNSTYLPSLVFQHSLNTVYSSHRLSRNNLYQNCIVLYCVVLKFNKTQPIFLHIIQSFDILVSNRVLLRGRPIARLTSGFAVRSRPWADSQTNCDSWRDVISFCISSPMPVLQVTSNNRQSVRTWTGMYCNVPRWQKNGLK